MASLLSCHSALRAQGLHLAPRWRNCGQGKPGSCPINIFADAPILCPAPSVSLLAEGQRKGQSAQEGLGGNHEAS